MTKVIFARNFGLAPGQTADGSLAVLRALEACRGGGEEVTLQFEPGIYHFHPERAFERLCWMSNNDSGLKRVVFPLSGFENLTIDGGGAEFILHGAITPFALENCRNITLRNFAMDWAHPVTLTGRVQDAAGQAVTLELEPDCTYRIVSGEISSGETGTEVGICGFIELNGQTLAPAYRTGDVWNGPKTAWDKSFEEIASHRVRFNAPEGRAVTVGNHIIFLRSDRNNPAIFVTESEQVTVENVTVYRAPAMAFIAQRSVDLTLERFNVCLRPDAAQIVTATADATHFVGCRGQITLNNCLLENQLDDPCNAHGIYLLLQERLSDRSLLLGRMHPQQKGVPCVGPGDVLEFFAQDTMNRKGQAAIAAVQEINSQDLRVTLTEDLPPDVEKGLVAENRTWVPDVTISGCVARRNRARGFLISTPGRVLIENNTISPGGAGILIPGECQFWYESGAVQNVTIRNNRFLDCNTSAWGRACIDATPHIPHPGARATPFHRNITIEGNRFETFDNGLLAAWSVDGIRFQNNVLAQTSTYAPFGEQKTALEFCLCHNVVIQGNRREGRSTEINGQP